MNNICFFVSLGFFVVMSAFCLWLILGKHKIPQISTAFKVFAGTVFVSATILFLPFHYPEMDGVWGNTITTFASSMHNALRLYLVDASFEDIIAYSKEYDYALKSAYTWFLGLLYILAPLLTLGFVLSFFKSFVAHIRYAIFGHFRDAYIFSELNDSSIALAKSLKATDPKRMIVFTDVFASNDETSYDLIEHANEIKAICFKEDITVVNFHFHSKKTKMYFFIIGSDDSENINHAMSLSKKYVKKGQLLVKTKNKEAIFNNIAKKLNEISKLNSDEKFDALSILIDKAFTSSNIGFGTEYYDSICNALIEEFDGVENVTKAYVSEFFSIYTENREKTEIKLPVINDSKKSSNKKETIYTFSKYLTPEDRENSVAASTGRIDGITVRSYLDDDDNFGYDYPRGDTRLYLFSKKFSSEQHLSSINPKHIKLRRVNNIQSLIYHILYTSGMDIFESARPTGSKVLNIATGEYDDEKKISALIVGMGLHGTELVKALSWFAQMHPYKLEINAIDKNEDADKIFKSACPDLFDINPITETPEPDKKYYNGDYETPGEAHYKISMYTGYDADHSQFDELVEKLSDTTYVFVSLGDDDINIRVATKLRILFKRMGIEPPIIHTIVYNPKNEYMLRYGRSSSGESYKIHPFGDDTTTYSEECILKSDLEEKALQRHMAYSKKQAEEKKLTGERLKKFLEKEEAPFWKYDYNYRSSMASVLHSEFKVMLNMPGSDKAPDNRSESEKQFIRVLEHQRWNAYVRSEGFVYSPVRDKMAKTHHLLIPFDKLPYNEQIKDDD